MSAMSDDLSRVQEIHDIITHTQEQLRSLEFTKERFEKPESDSDDLIAEGLMNRVFRVTEEAGRMSPEAAGAYGFDTRGARGVRNRFAHVYGEVDRGIVWEVIENDFPNLLESCARYCEDKGVDLG